jgi:hypothetical protein
MDQGIELLMPTAMTVPANAPSVDNSPLCRSMTNTCDKDPLTALNLKLVEPSSRVYCVCKLPPPIVTLEKEQDIFKGICQDVGRNLQATV